MDEDIELLKDLVSTPSVTGNTKEAAQLIKSWCISHGMDAEVTDGAVTVNPCGEELLLLGHFDTVPGGIPLRIENGELWGRGSVDAKGPLCAALNALKGLPELRDRVSLVGVPDEEGSSETAYRLRRTMKERPCIILEPSGWDGITISYNGRLLVEIEVTTPPSHSGHDIPFSTEVALDILDRIRITSKARLLEVHGDITRTRLKLDIRYPPDERPVLPQGTETVSIRTLEDVKPYRSDKFSWLVRSFVKAIRASGGDPVFKRKTGTADMNVLGEVWSTPIIAFGPGNGGLDHTDEERISLDEYRKGIEVLRTAIRDILS
ncbi:MAG: M20/M25/M40 family metallo-hydrolase [Candidatus Thermoplasmatota archaeon]|nr:M20/M25/M40 family metallo-hydrolase [Candidatus Thermoplasmatota archaeon]